MIKNRSLIDLFENNYARRNAVDYRRNLEVYKALYREACELGVLPLKDPLDSIDSGIYLARVMSVRRTS
jgi:hypothetical protein